MATKIRDLFVALGVKVDNTQLQKFDKGVTRAKAGMAALARAAVIATAAIVGVTVATAISGDEFAKNAKQLGLNVEELQELTFAADRSGASLSDLRVGIRRIAVTARDAAAGSKIAEDAFAALGVTVTDTEGNLKSTADLFEEVAGGLALMENETEKMALANDIFGRSGAKLLPLLNEGAAGIAELRKQAREYGFVMSEEAAAASEEFVDSITNAQAVLRGFKNTIGIALIPVLDGVIKRFTEWFLANRELIQQKTRQWADRLASAAERLAGFLLRVGAAVERIGLDNLIIGMQALTAAFVGFRVGQVVVGTFQALSAAAAILGVGLSGPVVAGVISAVGWFTLLGLVLEDLTVFIRGGDSALGQFVDDNREANTVFGATARTVESLVSLFNSLDKALGITPRLKSATRSMERLGEAFLGVASTGFDLFLEGVRIQVDLIASEIRLLSDFINDPAAAFGSIPDRLAAVAAGPGVAAQSGPVGAATGVGASTTTNTSSRSLQFGDININGGGQGMTNADMVRAAKEVAASQQRQAQQAFRVGAV